MRKPAKPKKETPEKSQPITTISATLKSGELVELIYDLDERTTSLIMSKNGTWWSSDEILDGERALRPYAADNNMLRHNVVLFPSTAEKFGSQGELIKEIARYIHKYVDLGDQWERLVSYYVLFTWVYDSFNEVPYLRIKGDYGTGKTRFLQIVGSVCYKPIFANGASTVSPLFHMLDIFRGTLIVDEADFRFSDETAEIAKIFNNGNVRGMPVLRAQVTRERDFNPRVFQVFGPKIVAMRGDYADDALESRFLTLRSRKKKIRDDVPINLPPLYTEEALTLRNKLLAYRLDGEKQYAPIRELENSNLTYRENQILIPLLSVIEDKKERAQLGKLIAEIIRTDNPSADPG